MRGILDKSRSSHLKIRFCCKEIALKLNVFFICWVFLFVLMLKVKAALSGLFDTDAYRHIVSLPLTEVTPSPEALHTKQA
jgi:hypothetical protein